MRKRKNYPVEFIEEAIDLVERDGLSCVQVEKDLGIGKGVVSRWIREKNKLKGDAFCGSGNIRPSEKEFVNLKKEFERVKRERDILKKAVAIFSKEPNRYSGS
jgi:transposase